jgi:hypothetical protein
MSSTDGTPVGHGAALELSDKIPHTTSAMQRGKEPSIVMEEPSSERVDLEDQHEVSRVTKSTHQDLRGMQRMGKDQQLVRSFRQLSITSFVALATATWEIGLFIISPALVDGGRAGLVWSILWCWIGFGPIILSMVCQTNMTFDSLELIVSDSGGNGKHGTNRWRSISLYADTWKYPYTTS